MSNTILTIDGAVQSPTALTLEDLSDLPAQIPDVSQLDPSRAGAAVHLQAILDLVRPAAEADYITLHASADDFHASIPLAEVRERAVIIYSLDGGELPVAKGGPARFFIPDHAVCHTAEIDECANVKFLDRIEFNIGKGHDNRPDDEEAHRKLHE